MTLSQQIQAATPAERRRIRAQAIADAVARGGTRVITRGRWRLTITSDPSAVQRKGSWCAELTVRVERDGRDVTPADLNPVRIVNPPLLVPDPAGDVVVEERSTDRRTGVETVETVRYREDPAAALLVVLRDLIRG